MQHLREKPYRGNIMLSRTGVHGVSFFKEDTMSLEFFFSFLRRENITPLIVGGFVRDKVLGFTPKDVDIELYGIGPQELTSLLHDNREKLGIEWIDAVGSCFGVIKIKFSSGQDVDISLPRRENKTGQGHRGFICTPDPDMSVRDAASRRDFTFNALAITPEGEILDFFCGQDDITARTIKATSPAFQEDPLRVLRGMQFAARYGFQVDPDTADICATLAGHFFHLPKERIWGEWEKLLVKGAVPSYGLRFLADTGWIVNFPELEGLIDLPQDEAWHPEGDVWNHTLQAVDAMVAICDREKVSKEDRIVLMLAALCHDLGKTTTTEVCPDGHIRSLGHAEAGLEPTKSFLDRIGATRKIIERVLPLVREHMAHLNCQTDKAVKRLAVRLGQARVQELAWVIEADHSARGFLEKGIPEAAGIMLEIARANKVDLKQPAPILMGRHLIALGQRPGPELGLVLKKAFSAQLEGTFQDLNEAIRWFQRL
jgi:tRNA nucleotidyltransferase (CCA-adding enzyme)